MLTTGWGMELHWIQLIQPPLIKWESLTGRQFHLVPWNKLTTPVCTGTFWVWAATEEKEKIA